MTCDNYRQLLLDMGWAADQRRGALEALRHLDGCADCQAAMKQYEQLQEQLKPSASDARPIDGWDAFEHRLLRAAEPRRTSWLPQAMKLAAAFLVGVTVIEVVRWGGTHQPAPEPTNPAQPTNVAVATPPFTPQEVVQHAQAFDQVSQAFDRKTSWVLLANDTSDVGLVDEPMVPQHKLLLLRLSMTHSGEIISSSDLMIVPGQSASLTVPIQQGQSLHYEIGTTPGDPTKLSLWAELQSPHGGQAIGALATQLQLQPNQKVSAGELVTSSGSYQLKVGFSQAPVGGGKL